MMAKVPDDVRGNPSLKTVERRKPNENGGWYEPDTKSVVMNGRPGQATQEFGAAIASELPKDIEPECKPKNANAVDFFDFATLHELGHSVDDNLQFMASREGKSEFGNWKSIRRKHRFHRRRGCQMDQVRQHARAEKGDLRSDPGQQVHLADSSRRQGGRVEDREG